MRAKLVVGALVLLVVFALARLSGPVAANHSYAATYSGAVSAGGTIAFDISPDGSTITRFALAGVPMGCGTTVDTEITGTIPITDHAFTRTSPPILYSGSFPAPQSAQGTVQYKQVFPSCTGPVLTWTATTPTAPPGPSPTPSPTPTPGPADDVDPPAIDLTGKLTQKAGRAVAVTVTSDEAGPAVAKGKVRIGAKRYRLGKATAMLAPGQPARLKLAVPRAARKAVAKALRAGRRVTASIRVTARDAAGNPASETVTVRLR